MIFRRTIAAGLLAGAVALGTGCTGGTQGQGGPASPTTEGSPAKESPTPAPDVSGTYTFQGEYELTLKENGTFQLSAPDFARPLEGSYRVRGGRIFLRASLGGEVKGKVIRLDAGLVFRER
jgi:hypothetical protein